MKTYNTAWFRRVLRVLENSDSTQQYLCCVSMPFKVAWETVPRFRASLVALGEQWIEDKKLTGINTSAVEKSCLTSYLFWTHQADYHERRIVMRQTRKDFLLWLIENNYTIKEPQQQ